MSHRYISSDKAFAHMDRLVAWQQALATGDLRPGPVTLEWDLTNRCSLGCQSCHFAHTHTRGPWVGKALLPMAYEGTGDVADPELVMRALQQARQAGVLGVVWTGGGEPTLHPYLLAIVAHGGRQGLRQGIYTHGGHIAHRNAGVLGEWLDWAVVSLDADTPQAYAHEKKVPEDRFHAACEGVRQLVAAGVPVVGVSYLLHAGNWTRAEAMLAHGRSLGATYVTFRPAIEYDADVPSRRTAKDLYWIEQAVRGEDYYPGQGLLSRLADEPDVEINVARFAEYEGWSGHGYRECLGVRLNATVTPDGRVWVCPNRRGLPDSQLGDLRTESFETLWRRHPGHHVVDANCRVMCRLHGINRVLADVHTPREHAAFV